MDLTTMWRKLVASEPGAGYTSLEAFRNDMNLIADNCEAYCRDRYPGLPPVRDKECIEQVLGGGGCGWVRVCRGGVRFGGWR